MSGIEKTEDLISSATSAGIADMEFKCPTRVLENRAEAMATAVMGVSYQSTEEEISFESSEDQTTVCPKPVSKSAA